VLLKLVVCAAYCSRAICKVRGTSLECSISLEKSSVEGLKMFWGKDEVVGKLYIFRLSSIIELGAEKLACLILR
jgi:hypothetical protein